MPCTNDSNQISVASTTLGKAVMAPAEGDPERKSRRKLVKKKIPQRHASMHFPERLKFGDDAHDDVTATNGKPAQHMNQSIFSMIAAAGSKTNFHARFDDESTDSEGDDDVSKVPASIATHTADTLAQALAGKEHGETIERLKKSGKHVEIATRASPRIPLPKLNLRTSKERSFRSQSTFLPSPQRNRSPERPKQITPRDAPVMSQMLAARAQLIPTREQAGEQQIADTPDFTTSLKEHGTLATRLMEIFGLEAPEDVVSGS